MIWYQFVDILADMVWLSKLVAVVAVVSIEIL